MKVYIEKVEEDAARCTYAFGGGPDALAGRVAVDKRSGDVAILTLDEGAGPPGAPFYLARVVPRLHALHDAGAFPEADRWTA